jgi:hypothetical protein
VVVPVAGYFALGLVIECVVHALGTSLSWVTSWWSLALLEHRGLVGLTHTARWAVVLGKLGTAAVICQLVDGVAGCGFGAVAAAVNPVAAALAMVVVLARHAPWPCRFPAQVAVNGSAHYCCWPSGMAHQVRPVDAFGPKCGQKNIAGTPLIPVGAMLLEQRR